MNRSVIEPFVVFACVFLAGCSNDVETVKESTLHEFSSTITVGQALDTYRYCEKPKWDKFKTPKGATVVEFSCSLDKALTVVKDLETDAILKRDGNRHEIPRMLSVQFKSQFVMTTDAKSYEIGNSSIVFQTDKGQSVFDLGIITEMPLEIIYADTPVLADDLAGQPMSALRGKNLPLEVARLIWMGSVASQSEGQFQKLADRAHSCIQSPEAFRTAVSIMEIPEAIEEFSRTIRSFFE